MIRENIDAENGQRDSIIGVSNWDDVVELKQSDEMVFLMDAKQARRVIKAIRKAAKEMGWEV